MRKCEMCYTSPNSGSSQSASVRLSKFYCDLTVGKSVLTIESVLIRNNTENLINQTLVLKCREVIGQFMDNSGQNHSLCVPLALLNVSCKPQKEILINSSSKPYEVNQTTERLTFFLQDPDDNYRDKVSGIKCEMFIHFSVRRIK